MRQTTQLNRRTDQHYEHSPKSCATLHKSKQLKDGSKATKTKKTLRPEAGGQEPTELGVRHQTAPSCPTHTGELKDASEDRLHQHPAEYQMETRGERRGPARMRPHRAVQTSREQSPNSSRGRSRSARKQCSTQRSGGPRPSTPQLPMLPLVVRMPHVTEAASRHLQPRQQRT